MAISRSEDGVIGHRDRKEARELAKAEGLTAFFAQENELFIDLDAGTIFPKAIQEALENNGFEMTGKLTTVSKSGKGKHIYICLGSNYPLPVRIALQVALGSDPMRETMNVLRLLNGCAENSINCLFETERESYSVKGWREVMSDKLMGEL